MRRPTAAFAVAAILAAAGCQHNAPAPKLPPMLIDQRGLAMPLSEALSHVAFRAYVPRAETLKYAAIPPLGGDDVTANDGFAVEYEAGRSAMLLSEWPKHDFDVTFSNVALREACAPVLYMHDGVVWLTRRNVLMTLQPDGNVPTAAIMAEARRLVAAGACR